MSAPLRVFLVDDHPFVRLGLRTAIEREAGFAVVGEADSCAEALVRIPALRPDLLVGDTHATLTIANDGAPPPPPDRRTEGLGLRQMRRRAALLGGNFTLEPAPGGGASLVLTLPRILPSIPQA